MGLALSIDAKLAADEAIIKNLVARTEAQAKEITNLIARNKELTEELKSLEDDWLDLVFQRSLQLV